MKLNAPNDHASHWKTQSGDIELSQVHLETLIFMLRKSNSKDHCKRWTRGLTRAGILACHGVRHLRSPEKSTSADGVQGNVTDCQGGHRLKDARCLGVRADPATCREAKIRADISPPGERGKSPASSDDGRDADEERCYRGSKEGGIHISWESEISCITWRWWRR